MTTKPEELKSLAEAQSKVVGEAWQRSAISRAYYASFHRCLAWESGLPGRARTSGRKGGVHQQLLDRLEKPSGACTAEDKKRSNELHRLLSAQRERRVKADYELQQNVSRKEMKRQLTDARALFKACDG